MKETSLVWFRQDLRLSDNPALALAIEAGRPIVPVFIWAPGEEGAWAPGGASRWWYHHALIDLESQLAGHGLRLIVRVASTSTTDALRVLAKECHAKAVYWNRRYEPAAVTRDAEIVARLELDGIETVSANGALLFEPQEIANKSGKPFQVFTPFWKHCRGLPIPRPVKVDLRAASGPSKWPKGVAVDDLKFLPAINWHAGLAETWKPTSAEARVRLKRFVKCGAEVYSERRDFPEIDGTSRLSPYLHFGQIGPREVWEVFAKARNFGPAIESGVLRQLFWREFAHHLLFHFRNTTTEPLRPEFALFKWEIDEDRLRKWTRGETGYPIVDAGMRQLWQTGWMHNRVRMIVASFLVKHLLQHWLDGAQWFWDTLVDADLANNTFGWQWTAGCGADAAPYFRVFNPIIQGKKFDPEGSYVKRFVPELAKVPAKFIHAPWDAGELELSAAGVVLGKTYPVPIIEHAKGREKALQAFADLKAQVKAQGVEG